MRSFSSPSPILDSVLLDVYDGNRDATSTVPAGTLLTVRLCHAIDLNGAPIGSAFLASLAEPVYVGKQIAVPEGTLVRGVVREVTTYPSAEVQASAVLTLTNLQCNGAHVPIQTDNFTWTKHNDARKHAGGGAIAEMLLKSRKIRVAVQSKLLFHLQSPISFVANHDSSSKSYPSEGDLLH